ncbi:MAG: hypothetical protein JWN70_5134 [Planctomycetaceae bacterium]|nr:hypothetical protein [Planctomycetaceae bacterium]
MAERPVFTFASSVGAVTSMVILIVFVIIAFVQGYERIGLSLFLGIGVTLAIACGAGATFIARVFGNRR